MHCKWSQSPYEVAKTQNQDRHTGELNHACQVRVEIFRQLRKHGRNRQRTKALSKGDKADRKCNCGLPCCTPILGREAALVIHLRLKARWTHQRIARVVGRMRYRYRSGTGPDRIVASLSVEQSLGTRDVGFPIKSIQIGSLDEFVKMLDSVERKGPIT